MVDGKSYVVKSRMEELDLLGKLERQANDQASIAKGLGDEALSASIAKKAKRIENKAESKAQMLARLLREDEEFLLGV